jgi:hypothetical protein
VGGTFGRVLTEVLASGGGAGRGDTKTERVLASLRWRFGLFGLVVAPAAARLAGWPVLCPPCAW